MQNFSTTFNYEKTLHNTLQKAIFCLFMRKWHYYKILLLPRPNVAITTTSFFIINNSIVQVSLRPSRLILKDKSRRLLAWSDNALVAPKLMV